MAKTIRMTTAQAIVKFLDNQYVSMDGVETKFVEGFFTIHSEHIQSTPPTRLHWMLPPLLVNSKKNRICEATEQIRTIHFIPPKIIPPESTLLKNKKL